MSGSDVQWSTIDVMLQGLNEHIDPKVLPPGWLVECVNLEFIRPGGLRKRPGVQRIITGATTSVPGTRALMRHANELIAVDDVGSATKAPKLQSLAEYGDRWMERSVAPNAHLRVRPGFADLAASGTADQTICNSFLIQAYGNYLNLYVKVVDRNTYAVQAEFSIGVGTPITLVRCAVNQDDTHALITVQSNSGQDIRALCFDCTANPISFAASLAVIATDGVSSTPYHDTNTGRSNEFVLCYRQNGAPDVLRVCRISTTPAILSSITIGTDPRAFSLRAINDDLYVNWLDGAAEGDTWQYAVRAVSDLTSVLGATNWAVTEEVPSTSPRSTIGERPDGSAMLFKSETLAIVADPTRILGLRRVDSAAPIDGGITRHRNASIAAKPWMNPGLNMHEIWVAIGNPFHQLQYGLLSIPESGINVTPEDSDSLAMFLHCITHTARVPNTNAAISPLLEGAPVSTHRDINGFYRSMVPLAFVVGDQVAGADELIIDYTHYGRYKSVEFAGSTIMTGSIVSSWDGERLQEVGFIRPEIWSATRSAAGGGSWSATGLYSYKVVYETVDANGMRHRSAPSPAKTATVTVNTDKVTLEIERLTNTRRLWGGSGFGRNNYPTVAIVIYRAPPGVAVWQRLHSFETLPAALYNDPWEATLITWDDLGADPTSLEVIYDTGGEVANNPPEGGATAICVHQDRVCLGGGEDPEIVWYSKPSAELRPAEFNFSSKFRIPGQQVVALESMDNALIALCERGIYGVYGEGPDARLLDGVFSVPQLIDAGVGCTQPRSTVVGPPGVFFKSQRGIELLDRNRQVKYIGAQVETTLALYPLITEAIVVPSKGQVRFSISNTAETAGRVLVYDYVEDKWSVWDYAAGGEPWMGMAAWNSLLTNPGTVGRGVAMLTKTGDLYEEILGYGADRSFTDFSFLASIETGWLSFGQLSGYLRVRKFHPVMQRAGNHGLDITMRYRYDETSTATRSFTQTEIIALPAHEPIRVYVPQPKQTSPAIKVRIAETTPSMNQVSNGFILQALSFEIGRLPGLARLPAANTR